MAFPPGLRKEGRLEPASAGTAPGAGKEQEVPGPDGRQQPRCH